MTHDRAAVDAIRHRLADPRDVARRLHLDPIFPQGSGVSTRCPAHGGVSLSIAVARDRTVWAKCFGCNFRGDVFTLIASARSLTLPRDFGETLREAAALASMDLPALSPMREQIPTLPDATFDAVARALLRGGLQGSVAEYVRGRGIAEDARVDGWGALPWPWAQGDAVARMLAEFGAPVLLASGLFLDDPLVGIRFARPGARLLIPWRGANGRVLSLQRRRLDAGEPRYVAPAGRPLRQPYGVERLATHPRAPVVFVEGAIDALALRALCGSRPVVPLALPGVEAWREAWAAHARGRVAFVGLDGDAAGEGKVGEVTRHLEAAGALSVRRWRPGGGCKDWAERLARG